MSEKTEIKPLQVGPFVLAMAGGPLLVTAFSFWLAFIPVYALAFGAIPYLVIGTPMALWMALTGPVTIDRAMQWSGLTILFFAALACLYALLTRNAEAIPMVLLVAVVSALFGVIWAAASGWLYGKMTTENAV